ncbi:hypothetical protein [Halobacterium yunchengense]|uniref:hypothetical protein n=1 Tax=Halobacterium yunchengense TaxID=3108497 RepID=UPI0030081AB6
MDWLTVDDAVTSEREFYLLWGGAALAYGGGDVVTTVALAFYAPGLQEGNPVVATAVDAFGLGGLVAAKLAVFACCLALSVYAMHAWRDRVSYAFPPLLLAAVGAALTALNLRLLVG